MLGESLSRYFGPFTSTLTMIGAAFSSIVNTKILLKENIEQKNLLTISHIIIHSPSQ